MLKWVYDTCMDTKKMEQTKRLVADVSELTHRRVKILTVNLGIKLQDWVAEAIAEKLAREEQSNDN